MTQTIKMMLLVVAAAGLIIFPGCAPRMVRHVARAAVVGAVVTGAVAAAAVHHAHHHHRRCGHHRRWHHGRWVYHYEGHREYYDEHHGRWYRYHD